MKSRTIYVIGLLVWAIATAPLDWPHFLVNILGVSLMAVGLALSNGGDW